MQQVAVAVLLPATATCFKSLNNLGLRGRQKLSLKRLKLTHPAIVSAWIFFYVFYWKNKKPISPKQYIPEMKEYAHFIYDTI